MQVLVYLSIYFEITNYHYVVGKIDANSYNTVLLTITITQIRIVLLAFA